MYGSWEPPSLAALSSSYDYHYNGIADHYDYHNSSNPS
jgi:hypothetical protein